MKQQQQKNQNSFLQGRMLKSENIYSQAALVRALKY